MVENNNIKHKQGYLQNLGFIEGREVKVLSDIGGDVIVGVLDSRIALNKEMASHIYV